MAGKASDDMVRCSFCNKPQSQVRKLIAGPNGAYICDECIEVCSEIIEEEFEYDDDRREFDDINLLTPVHSSGSAGSNRICPFLLWISISATAAAKPKFPSIWNGGCAHSILG